MMTTIPAMPRAVMGTTDMTATTTMILNDPPFPLDFISGYDMNHYVLLISMRDKIFMVWFLPILYWITNSTPPPLLKRPHNADVAACAILHQQ